MTSFDVIYHRRISNDREALVEMARVLRPQGLVLLRVPAFQLLQGRHDVAVHTRHRYRKHELEQLLIPAGFAIEFISYLNCFLFPVAILRRSLERLLRPGHQGSEVEPVAPWLNALLYRVLTLEAEWIGYRPLPFGLSLVAVARKKSVAPRAQR